MKTKVSEMGTTGHICYIAQQRGARRQAMAMGAVLSVIKSRHGSVHPQIKSRLWEAVRRHEGKHADGRPCGFQRVQAQYATVQS